MKTTSIKIISFVVVLVMFFAGMAFGKDAEYVMKIGLANPKRDLHHSWSPHLVLKTEIEARSGGRIKVELYPGAQLGGIESMVNQVRQGVIQGCDPSEGHFAPVYPEIQVFSIPYLFAEREIAWKVLDGPFGQMMIEDMAKKTGLRALHWSENGGFRHYSNDKRAIHSPEDMKGLKIRTMNIPLHMKIVSDLGASPTPIAWAELYTSLQTGVVDGQENAIATFLIPKLEEVQKYIVLDGHVYSVNTVAINEKWYQSLPEDLKKVIQDAQRIALAVNRGLTVTNEVMGIEYLQSKGIEIYKPTKEEKQQFKALTQESAIKWLRETVDEKWIDGVLEATKQAEKELGY